ncbi:MAG: hypothetical protein D6773_10395 [Alphaproteobacteria bacterium]|nr:MAG: hypothetical protein D6773_10395 [Alphaproteobacteria bacterium]
MRVVHHKDGAIIAICDEGRSERIALTKDDTALYAVDLAALRGRICDTLQLRSARDPLGSLPGVLRVGAWEPKPSVRIPVVLLVVREEHALRVALHETTLAARNPIIVLTPTRDLWHDEALALAEERKALLAPACGLIVARRDEWVASEVWDLNLGQFVQTAGIRIAGGFSNLKKKVRVAKAGATAAKLKAELRQRFQSARKHLLDTGDILPMPEVQEIASACGLHPSTAGRWLNGEYKSRDKELELLWSNISDPDYIRTYRD